MKRFELVRAKSVSDAVKGTAAGATLKAGGIDIVLLMKDRIAEPARLVDLQAPELRAIESGATLRIGALATLAEVASHADVQKLAAALATAAGDAATPQVRNMATVGGNLCQRPRCWYFRMAEFACLKKGGDGCPAILGENQYHAIFGEAKCPIVHPSNLGPALVALDAKIHVQGPKGARTLGAEEFFDTDDVTRENALAAGDVITAVEVAGGWKSVQVEVRERQSFDWPLASVAVARTDKVTRVVFGAVAPRPWRIAAVEKAVAAGDMKKACEAIAAAAKPLSKNGYKVQLLQALLPRALEALK
jgi:xanthine dehydrogenase YagS FAD-binding subunit